MPTTVFTRSTVKAIKGAKQAKQAETFSLNARPDRVDLRDMMYQPKLVNLPEVSPAPALMQKWVPVFNTKYAAAIADWRKSTTHIQQTTYSPDYAVDDRQTRTSPKHGTFDNDIAVINTTIARIIGAPPQHPATWLAGF